MSISMEQAASALLYQRVRVTATAPPGTAKDPTADTVQWGFQPSSVSAATPPSTWVLGSWETGTEAGQTAYFARCLVGPAGDFTPAQGSTYWVWLRITDNPEVPVFLVGTLKAT